jgi:molybdate transport system regulatory protein
VGDAHSLGPGKAALLEAIGETGSISAAARKLGMAYRHAWELVDDLNACFASPVVYAAPGGREGGGARLMPFGEELVARRPVSSLISREGMEYATRTCPLPNSPALAELGATLRPLEEVDTLRWMLRAGRRRPERAPALAAHEAPDQRPFSDQS